MRIGSLFSGYGGLDIAVQNVYGGSVVWYSEIEKAACTVLAERHPGVLNLGDIKAVDWSTVEPVDILTGGYPCQPFSTAGNRKGKNDERHLWPYVLDAIRAIRPRYTILENVSGHLTLGLADVLADLADVGMSARWGVVRASDTGAPHNRARVFIIAYPARGARGAGTGRGISQSERPAGLTTQVSGSIAHADSEGLQGSPSGGGETQTREHGLDQQGAGSLTAITAGSRLQGSDIGAAARRGADQSPTSGSRASDSRTSTNGDADSNDVGEIEKVSAFGAESSGVCTIDWGKYAPAIRRWETVLNRPAPAATVERKNKRRLNPQFVEWMMGLELGHVTGHGLSAAQELKMLGNGVVPQQAELALRMLAVV